MIELDFANFERGHREFLRLMKQQGNGVPFTDFQHKAFRENEMDFKEKVRTHARTVAAPQQWSAWRNEPGRIVEQLKEACKPAISKNLLEHKYGPEKGSYAALYRLANEDDTRNFESLCAALHESVQGDALYIGKAVDAFADFLRARKLGCNWDFVAYLLFLLHDDFFPIRSEHFESLLKFYGVDAKIAGHVVWNRYQTILFVAEAVKEKLSRYGTTSALQVQSYMWIVSQRLPLDDERDDDGEPDLSDELRSRQRRANERERIGLVGEKFVFDREKQVLIEADRDDLASRVRMISREGSDAGYDILSFTEDGQERHIEVKATCRSRDNDNCFWLSANEAAVGEHDPSWTVYRVWRIDRQPHYEDLGNIVQQGHPEWSRELAAWSYRRQEA